MNRGLDPREASAKAQPLEQTHFTIGAVTSSFKLRQGELIPQYLKLQKKIECGAQFIINQIGFDSRKISELRAWLSDLAERHSRRKHPSSATSTSSTPRVAEIFHSGRIPGVVLTDPLADLCRQQRRLTRPGQGLLPRVCRQTDRHLPRPRLPRRLPRRRSRPLRHREDPRPRAHLRPRRLAPLRPRDPVLPPWRVLLTTTRTPTPASPTQHARRHARPPFKTRNSRRIKSRSSPHHLIFEPSTPFARSRRQTLRPRQRSHRKAPPHCAPSNTSASPSSTSARTAATARCPKSPISAPNRSAPRTSATAPAVALAPDSVRSKAMATASGSALTSACSTTAASNPSSTTYPPSRTSAFAAPPPGPTTGSAATTQQNANPRRQPGPNQTRHSQTGDRPLMTRPLHIIGELMNNSFARARKAFIARDPRGYQHLAKLQADAGAHLARPQHRRHPAAPGSPPGNARLPP